MRRLNGVWSIFTFSSSTQVNGVAITTGLAIVEDKAVSTDTFFVNHLVDYCIYVISAQLLLAFVRRAVTDYHYFTTGVVTHFSGYSRQYSFSIIAQLVRFSSERNTW